MFFLLYKRNRFHAAVRLFSNRSQMTSKCGKNKPCYMRRYPSVSLMFLPHFDVICKLYTVSPHVFVSLLPRNSDHVIAWRYVQTKQKMFGV